jgi:hypothetical protein
MSRWSALAVVVAVALVPLACSSGPRPTSAVLLPSPGPGYHLSSASGPVTKQALGFATALPPEEMASYLASVTFRRAAERVWTSPADGFVTDIVVEVGNDAQAAALVSTAGRVLPGAATRSFAVGDNGRGFVQTSDVRGQTMFCVIAFLSSGLRAFVLTRCTPYPQDTTSVSRLATEQIRRSDGR